MRLKDIELYQMNLFVFLLGFSPLPLHRGPGQLATLAMLCTLNSQKAPSGEDFREVGRFLGASPAGGSDEVHRLLRIPECAQSILL